MSRPCRTNATTVVCDVGVAFRDAAEPRDLVVEITAADDVGIGNDAAGRARQPKHSAMKSRSFDSRIDIDVIERPPPRASNHSSTSVVIEFSAHHQDAVTNLDHPPVEPDLRVARSLLQSDPWCGRT
jgi:hypothetical protein